MLQGCCQSQAVFPDPMRDSNTFLPVRMSRSKAESSRSLDLNINQVSLVHDAGLGYSFYQCVSFMTSHHVSPKHPENLTSHAHHVLPGACPGSWSEVRIIKMLAALIRYESYLATYIYANVTTKMIPYKCPDIGPTLSPGWAYQRN